MKKIYMILAAAALVAAAAACQKNETPAPETEPADQSVSLNITVASLTPDTKAIKTGWEDVDILHVYLEDATTYESDFDLQFDHLANSWYFSKAPSEAVIARLVESGGHLHGFWEDSNYCMTGGSWDKSGNFINFPGIDVASTTGVYGHLVADFRDIPYTYSGGVITANINSWRFRTDLQIVISGLTFTPGRYTLYSEQIENLNSICINSNNIGIPIESFTDYMGTGSDFRIAGISNDDGVAFVGAIASTAEQNYVINVKDNTTGVVYTFNKTVALSSSSNTKVVAIKIPISKFYVDMGLSVKWGAYNLGATAAYPYFPAEDTDDARHATWGDYYAWGELEPYYTDGHAYLITSLSDWKSGKDDGYDWASYKFDTSGNGSVLTKYKSGGTDFSFLQPEDDVITTEMGGSWRIPRYGDWEQLRDPSNCTWEWDATNKGYKVTSLKTGYTSQYIFLPAAGSWAGNVALTNPGEDGCYWSSSLDTSSGEGKFARGLDFNASTRGASSVMRFLGNSIRPVHP